MIDYGTEADALPISQRVATAREQLSGMFAGGELDALDDYARSLLRGLEGLLLELARDAFDLENTARSRRPEWMRWWGGRL